MDPKLLEVFASLLWPILILVFFLAFRSTIGDLLKSGRKFSVKVAGNELTFEEATEQQRVLLRDFQTQITDLESKIESLSSVSITNDKPTVVEDRDVEPVRSILWVDDIPKNNSYLIAYLEDKGVEVTTSLSSRDALNLLEGKRYDRVISDMGRPDELEAGIDLTRKIREFDKSIPILIFCGPWAAKNLRDRAFEAGINGMTASTSELVRLLDLENRSQS